MPPRGPVSAGGHGRCIVRRGLVSARNHGLFGAARRPGCRLQGTAVGARPRGAVFACGHGRFGAVGRPGCLSWVGWACSGSARRLAFRPLRDPGPPRSRPHNRAPQMATRPPSSFADAMIPRGNEPPAHNTATVAASGNGRRGVRRQHPAPAGRQEAPLARPGANPALRTSPGAPRRRCPRPATAPCATRAGDSTSTGACGWPAGA